MVYLVYLVSRTHFRSLRYIGGNLAITQEEEIITSMPLLRPVLDQITDKWSIMILVFICPEPQRFNAIKRRLNGVTQKALTQTLRRLEKNGLVSRRVIPVSPVAVEYSLTQLGHSLREPFAALYAWTTAHIGEIQKAQQRFERHAAKVSRSPRKQTVVHRNVGMVHAKKIS